MVGICYHSMTEHIFPNISSWRLKKQRYALVGEVCPHCDAKIFPPRDVCIDCHGEVKEPFAFSGKGEIYSYTTTLREPTDDNPQTEVTLALVKLNEGPMVTAQLTDMGGNEVQIGMLVEMVTRKLKDDGDERGMIIYGYKFRPAVK